MSFSVGILYSTQEFLKFIDETPVKTNEFVDIFKKFEATSPTLILEVAENSNWIQSGLNSEIKVTERGQEVLSKTDMKEALRVQLKHLINDIKPAWSYLIHRGRKEALQYFPVEVKQCFKEAGLIHSYSEEVVKWWDTLAAIARDKQEGVQLETGRLGESLSLAYEFKRTGSKPIWQAVDSNFSGFDILSRISETDATPLRIEVKASKVDSSLFTFFLSRNEWDVAERNLNHVFHFWKLSPEPELYIFNKNDIAAHIPINQGEGLWESVKIEVNIKGLKILNKNL